MDERPARPSSSPAGYAPRGTRARLPQSAPPLRDDGSPTRTHAAGVVLAGGEGSGFEAEGNKAYLPLAGRSLASWALRALAAAEEVGPLVLVVSPAAHRAAHRIAAREVDGLPIEIVFGGDTRQESHLLALRHLAGRIDSGIIDIVVIHDAARPLAPSTLTAGVIHEAREHGGAIPCIPADDLVEVDHDGMLTRSSQRLLRPQTPHAFEARSMLAAYEAAARESYVGDTTSCIARFSSINARWIMGETRNLEISDPRDLFLAEQILAASGYAQP